MEEEDKDKDNQSDCAVVTTTTVPSPPKPSSSSDLNAIKVPTEVKVFPGPGLGTTPPPAKKTPNDFIFGKLLGEGSFSSVYLAKDVKTSKEYAIKVCDKQHIIRERKAESIRREKEVLTILSANRSLKAPFFVHLYATFQDAHRLYFVVTYAHGGELLKYLHKVGPFPPPISQFYLAEILQALRHLHSNGIVHRDLKPENILLNEHGHILITDFGSAKVIKSSSSSPPTPPPPKPPTSESSDDPPASSGGPRNNRSNSFVGTAQYVSPEVLKGRYSEVGPPADLWAFGCIIYQLIGGVLPFQANNEFLIFQKILKLDYQFPQGEGFPPKGKDLIEGLLRLEPLDRLGAKDNKLYESIQGHPFFEGVDFDGLSEMEPPVIKMTTAGPVVQEKGRRKGGRERVPEHLEPGFDPRAIAERVLRSEEDFMGNGDMSDDSSDGELQIGGVDGVVEGMEKLKVGEGGGIKGAVVVPRDEEERKRRLEEQLKMYPKYHGAVKGNLILKWGLVNKRKGLFARKRLLFLTEGPHLFYCEPGSVVVKGEMPWSRELRPEAKDFKFFFVHTPNRTYNLEDPEGYALEWCRAINEIHQHVYGNP